MPSWSVELLVATAAHEGPVHVPAEGALYVTVERGIRRIDLATGAATDLAADVVRPNGMTLDASGDLLVCEQGDLHNPARLSRVDRSTGTVTTVVDGLRDLPLNSPNDVAVGPDGAIWFTDPSYGFLQGFRPRPSLGDFVHRVDPASGAHDVVADGFDKPNGIALSPDGTTLYVGDSGANHEPGSFDPARPHHVEAFDVVGARLDRRRLVAVTHPGFPDGLKVARDGRIFVSAASGVQVFTPAGDLLGEIPCPGAVNFAFHEPDQGRLYMTAEDAVLVASLDTRPGPSDWAPTVTTGARR